jgi:chromosome segregation ATPase
MICKTIKKGVVGAALGAGALALLFGTSAPSYVRTVFHKVRHNAKAAVPIQFEIDRARQEIADLEPAIHQNIEAVEQAKVEVEHLQGEILATNRNLETESRKITALRNTLGSGDVIRTGGVTYSADEIRSELGRRYDHYKAVKRILADREETLKLRQRAVVAAQEKLENMIAAKKTLAVKIEGIEAHLQQIEASKAASEFSFDDSALARAKKTVGELDKRLEVMARVVEAEGRYADAGVPVVIEPGRDVVKEIDADAEFNAPSKDTARSSADKSL